MTNEHGGRVHLSAEDLGRLRQLRAQKPAREARRHAPTRGAMIADRVAETVGSWRFIVIQSGVLTV